MEPYMQFIEQVPDDKRAMYQAAYMDGKKDGTIGVILALLLGGFGAHKFYMGKVGQGVLYLLFVWTFIPALVALIEAFFMPGRARDHNRRLAQELAVQFGAG